MHTFEILNYTRHKAVFGFDLKVISFSYGEDLGEVNDKKSENHFQNSINCWTF